MTASPQLEDGYIRIANELMDVILRFGFTLREVMVLLAIIRKTYGYGKKTDDISASQLSDMCGIARQHVTTTLNMLAQCNVITKKPGRFGSIIGIQKNYKKWVSSARIKELTTSPDSVQPSPTEGQGCHDLGHVPKQDVSSHDLGQVDSHDLGHTKDNVPKDNPQKIYCAPPADRELELTEQKTERRTGRGRRLEDRFSDFYTAYPRKKSRQNAFKAFAKINPDETMLAEIIAGVTRAMKSEQWRDVQYIPHPATWLNAGGWMDEIRVEYSPEQLEVIAAYNEALGDSLGHVDAAIFVAKRAGMISDFLTLSEKVGFHVVYFAWVRDKCELPPRVGFDWLIQRDTFTKVKGGQYEPKDRT